MIQTIYKIITMIIRAWTTYDSNYERLIAK